MRPFTVSSLPKDERRLRALLLMADHIAHQQAPDDLLKELSPSLEPILPLDCVGLDLRSHLPAFAQVLVKKSPKLGRIPLPIAGDSLATAVWRSQTVFSAGDITMEESPGSDWLHQYGIRSYCAFPVSTRHQKLGVVFFGSEQPYAFSDDDITFLRWIAELTALALSPSFSVKAFEEERRGWRLLLKIADSAVTQRGTQELIVGALAHFREWAPRDYVGIYLYDGASRSLRLHMLDPQLAEKMTPRALAPLRGTLVGQVFREGRTAVLDHAALARHSFPSVRSGTALGVQSLCMAPLMTVKGPVGVLKFASQKDHAFSEREVDLIEQAAAIIAPALDRARSASPSIARNPTLQHHDSSNATAGIDESPVNFEERDLHASIWFGEKSSLGALAPLLNAYLNTSHVGLCVLDRDLKYVAINQRLAEMNGIAPEKHLGKSVREMLGDLAELLEPQIRRVFATGEPVMNLEITFLLFNRAEPGHWVGQYVPLRDFEGTVRQVGVLVVEDTEQKKLTAKLQNADERLREEKKRQEIMVEVTRTIARGWQPQHTFSKVSAYLRRLLRQEYAALALRDEASGKLVRQAIDFPLAKSAGAGEEISVASASSRKALRQRSPYILGGADIPGSEPQVRDSLMGEGIKSLCCVPLLRLEDPVGVLVLGSTRPNAFRTEDVSLLDQVAAQLAIALENARIVREVKQLKRTLDQEKSYLHAKPASQSQFTEIIGDSRSLRSVIDHALIVAPSDATVLLLGETGTGKGMMARLIHRASRRKDQKFVNLNCAAIPTGLLESELFGHERGAFTGAVSQKIGRLELAHNGTLFLDEIGEIPMELQPKLLRVLQDHEFERLGSTRTIKVDLRLIAATNRDLSKSVAEKEFRHDLFYRLNVFPLRLPALRERKEDIPALVRHFITVFARQLGREIERVPEETMEALINWHWPGNVRELENFIERSVILTDGPVLRVPLRELKVETNPESDSYLAQKEREHIIRVLRETHGTIAGPEGAARRLGLKRTTLQSKIQKLGITRREYSEDSPSHR